MDTLTTGHMSKREARAYLRRASAALRELNAMLTSGGEGAEWVELCNEAIGAVAHVQEPFEGYSDHDGINGITTEEG